MSDLRERVLRLVEKIPEGRAMTYGDIARVVGTSPRAVGRILHGGGHEVPWWRVVDAEGHPYAGAIDAVCARFHDEATPLSRDGDAVRVDLDRASWVPTGI